jgi:hypothetical protein
MPSHEEHCEGGGGEQYGGDAENGPGRRFLRRERPHQLAGQRIVRDREQQG